MTQASQIQTWQVPSDTRKKQQAASDPFVSAWVSANAGSGKTTVLSRRVIRLLLSGAPPERILCLTFTKAAAANMQNRIFTNLGRWATLTDEDLATELFEIEGEKPSENDLARARRIFAHAIEAPGGLKILTVHAFCERVLHLFPFEANVPAGFSVLEDRAADELLKSACNAILIAANQNPESPLGVAMSRVIEDAGEDLFAKLISEVTAKRGPIRWLLRDAGTPAIAAARLARMLGLEANESVETLDETLFAGSPPASEWLSLASALREAGGTHNARCAEGFERAFEALDHRIRRAFYLGVFTTFDGKIRSGKFITKEMRLLYPAMAERLDAERNRLAIYLERRKLCLCLERTRALLTVADAILQRFEAGKRAKARLDFDDLVSRTVSLLHRAGAEWVLYKLDQGIDHILVDEAQDTSPHQWQIIERLAHEFTAGEGARAVLRTLFAVGDEKQSIYSFQGAAPSEFETVKRRLEKRVKAAGLEFRSLHLTHSFRSTPDVIGAVDLVFSVEENRRGLSSDPVFHPHETVRIGEPGRVEVWPIEQPDPSPEIEAWDAPFDTTSLSSPPVKLARRIAAAVHGLTNKGCSDTDRRFSPGDVMVLVRSRNQVFEAVIRELKRCGVPVAGADRLALADHIAAMDLLALARFALLPADDLTLAAVLKTPLIGLDDDHLIRLAPGRAGSLWQALQDASEQDGSLRHVLEKLQTWIDRAAFQSPFAFFSDVLSRDGGRQAFLDRLGLEASDALDEFLNVALSYEKENTPSLQNFVTWLEQARHEVKRDMDIARGEVRVMTVHGAKGLEAKVVILADTCGAPDGRHHPKLFFVPDPNAPPDSPPLMLWSSNKASDPPHAAEARDVIRVNDEAEHRRLLYVAMTRAEDRLIVAGFEGARARRPGNWYDMVADALRDALGARMEPMPDGQGERIVWEKTARARRPPSKQAEPPTLPTPPDWLRRPARPEASPQATLRPSSLLETSDEDTLPSAGWILEESAAVVRGQAIHWLLQALPGLAPEEMLAAALRFLAKAAPDLAGGHPAIAEEAIRIVNDPIFAPVFAEGSRAEVPLIGRIVRPGGIEQSVSGRIDRLAVTEKDVLVVDFKTNRRPILRLSDVPKAYLIQLALYQALLQPLYPDHRIRAALIWTADPSLMEIPNEILDAEARMSGIVGIPIPH